MANLPQDSESSGYNTSASSEFGSLEERFKFPVNVVRSATKKRKAEEKLEELDDLLKERLVLSPEKRSRTNSTQETTIANSPTRNDGRPRTRRSTSSDIELSPRVRALRAANTTYTIDMVRTVSALCTDSISPKLLKKHNSPRRRHINLNESGSIYSKHRLGATFSPLVVGAKRKLGTPSQGFRGFDDKESPDMRKQSGLRKSGNIPTKRLLSDRFKALD